nr:hypothetical protein [Alcaligenes sp. HPC1271]
MSVIQQQMPTGKRNAAMVVFLIGMAIALYTHFYMPGESSLWA